MAIEGKWKLLVFLRFFLASQRDPFSLIIFKIAIGNIFKEKDRGDFDRVKSNEIGKEREGESGGGEGEEETNTKKEKNPDRNGYKQAERERGEREKRNAKSTPLPGSRHKLVLAQV